MARLQEAVDFGAERRPPELPVSVWSAERHDEAAASEWELPEATAPEHASPRPPDLPVDVRPTDWDEEAIARGQLSEDGSPRTSAGAFAEALPPEDAAPGPADAASSSGCAARPAVAEEGKLFESQISGGKRFELLREGETGSLLFSPNGMFKARIVYRLWRTGRLRLGRAPTPLGWGPTLVVLSEHGLEVGSFQLLRMDADGEDAAAEDELAAGDTIVAPNCKSKVHFVCADDLVVADEHDKVVWCMSETKGREICLEWRRLPTRLKRQLVKEGIDSEVWNAIRGEEAAPRGLYGLVHYVLQRRREMTYFLWQTSLVTTEWSL